MWLKPQGFAEIITPNDGMVNLDHVRKEHIHAGATRMDTCTCFHCGGVFHVSARMRPEDIGGLCWVCMHPICPKCLDKPCSPWEKQMDTMEKRRIVSEWF